MKDYYKEIDKVIKEYEEHRSYTTKSIGWICDRIDWCWKWKKITKEQMEELADRIVAVMKGEI